MNLLSRVATALSLCLVVACGDDSEELAGVPLQAYAEQHRDALCAHFVNCSFMPDQSTCLAAVRVDPSVVQAVAAVQGGRLAYNPGAARQCVDTIRSYTCSGDTLMPRPLREACDGVFGNRLGEGEACFSASECEGLDAVCEGSCTDSCCQGTCKLAAAGAAPGQPCDAMTPCREGYYCGSDGMGGVACVVKPGPGEDCTASSSCVAGYACDPATLTCFKQADSGAACNPDLAADGCAAVFEYCDVTTKKCTPYPKPGAACAANAYATSICVPYADCDGTTCISRAKAGEACPSGICIGEGQGPYGFTPALSCEGGTCAAGEATTACFL